MTACGERVNRTVIFCRNAKCAFTHHERAEQIVTNRVHAAAAEIDDLAIR